MKTEYQYILFSEDPPRAKTSIWRCLNRRNQSTLGLVSWEAAWRQYTFAPSYETTFSAGCLRDIADFIRQLMDARRVKGKGEGIALMAEP